MADFDLSGLSPRSFERLVQALAAKILGPGIVIFGDGPDGGREATYQGRIPFPSQAENWDGYIVVQAKFLQRPQDPGKDGKWAAAQLQDELKAFLDPQKRRRRPDYYIFATNVVLTPAGEKGGKDSVDAVFRSYKRKLRLKGWRIWDFDQIGTFLYDASDVRRAYAAWTMPGDVLSAVMADLQTQRPDFLKVMTNYLAKELLSDQYANLGQAGHSTEYKIPLASVFVDLPVTPEGTTAPPATGQPEDQDLPGLVSVIVDRSRDRLDSAARPSPVTVQDLLNLPGPEAAGRYVLVGGPGQGKSTVGQFACQLFRVALLRERAELSVEVRLALEAISRQCTTDGPSLPQARRFPVRIVLSAFADALAKEPPGGSVLAYVAQHVERVSGFSVSPDDLRRWLGRYPWFIVLDGLDEVPASTNREALLAAIAGFWIDAAQANADLLVVATTRPQGYNDDFSPAIYRHIWLAPLSPARAMHYARKLAENRWGPDTEQCRRVVAYLQKASEQEATARLMRSPLQVTIMATLVDQIGPPPQDRWRLFYRYYDVIYGREQERNIPASQLLRDHKPDIDAIHSHVALVLQLESERVGGAEARMTAARFERIVMARLEQEGQSGEPLRSLTESIIAAATNRLVFLVGPQEGQIGFEIRSLQEFMAAEALTRGSDQNVQDRLHRIAPLASWRNVFLFAAGRCFAQDQYRRDTVCTICAELDTASDPLVRMTRSGSILALELLEDGVADQQPKYARILGSHALGILELPPSEHHVRLAGVCKGEIEGMFRESIERRLGLGGAAGESAWGCLFPLIGNGTAWARTAAEDHWPATMQERIRILRLGEAWRSESWFSDKVTQYGHRCSFSDLEDILSPRGARAFDPKSTEAPFWAQMLNFLQGGLEGAHRRLSCSLKLGNGTEKTSIQSVKDSLPYELRLKGYDATDVHRDWKIIGTVLQFEAEPSRASLARALEVLPGLKDFERLRWWTAWPLAACVQTGNAAVALEMCRDGKFGDLSDWTAAEERWVSHGVDSKDFLYMTDVHWPFDREIRRIGFPFGAAQPVGFGKVWGEVLDIYRGLRDASRLRAFLADMRLFDASGEALETVTVAELTEMMLNVDELWPSPFLVRYIAEKSRPRNAWTNSLNELGQRYVVMLDHRLEPATIRRLGAIVQRDKSLIGILRLIGNTILEGGVVPRISEIRAEDCDDPQSREAAVTVEVAQGRLDSERAEELARIVSEMSRERPEVVFRVVRLLDRSDISSAGTDHLLTEILRVLDDSHSQAIVLRGLGTALRRRKSDLNDRKVWRELALPERLFEVMAE